MNTPHDPAERLLHLAKHASPLPVPDETPLGFATRVLAELRVGRKPTLWESMALGALPTAAVITLACVLLGSPDAKSPDDADSFAQLMLENQLPTPR